MSAVDLSHDLEVFETEDVPKSTSLNRDVHEDEVEKSNENIITTAIRPEMAFESFAGKIYDPRDCDFSDTLSRTKLALHMTSGRPSIPLLSPMQKMLVLKHEINELEEEIQESLKMETTPDQLNPKAEATARVLKDAADSLHRLDSMIEAQMKTSNFLRAPRVIGQLDELSSLVSARSVQAVSPETTNQNSPALAKADTSLPQSHLERWSRLEQRLKDLEKVSGVLSAGVQMFGHDNLLEAVSSLEKRLVLFDPDNLERIGFKVKRLQSQLLEIEAQSSNLSQGCAVSGKSSPTLIEDDERLRQLLESVNKVDDIVSIVPDVVARLRSLQTLHEKGATIVTRVNQLDEHGQYLDKMLESTMLGMEQLKVAMAENTQLMKSNCESIQCRIESLISKV